MTLADVRVTVNAPSDPEYARLWSLAVAKFGQAPTTKADYAAITEAYHALLGKSRGTISQVIREICEKAPGGD
jgi:hypothetical protein